MTKPKRSKIHDSGQLARPGTYRQVRENSNYDQQIEAMNPLVMEIPEPGSLQFPLHISTPHSPALYS
jgi:hypothetical protein